MKTSKKILSCLIAVSMVLCSLLPCASVSASAQTTLVTVQPYWSNEDSLEGAYYELQPDKTITPEMPDVLKNRKPKHHVFERNEDHEIQFRPELIMPGDTFEIPTEITRDTVYTIDFCGRGDAYIYKFGNHSYSYYEYSPEKYGIEVTGSVDVIDYVEYDSGSGVSIDGKHVTGKFFNTAVNNLNCPIIVGETGAGGWGPYVYHDDYIQYISVSGVTYTVLSPYYFLSYRFYSEPSGNPNYERISWEGFDEFLWENNVRSDIPFWLADEFENLKFPEYYWLTDIPYTIKIPNMRREGNKYRGWMGYVSEDELEFPYGNFSQYGERIGDEYTELSVCWTPHLEQIGYSLSTEEEIFQYYGNSNFYDVGTLHMTPMLGGNQRTIYFDANGGTIKNRDKWLIEVNEVKREDTPQYGENGESRIPDDGDFGFDINDYVPEKPGDTFFGWCAKPSALYTSFVTKDSTIEAYRYFWENDEYGTFTDKYTRQRLYAKWASETEEAFEKNGWKLTNDGTLHILNDDGANAWCEARKADPTLAPKVKNIQLGLKDEKVTYLPKRCFEGCTSLKELTFDENVSFGAYAFAGCTNLTDVTLNNTPSGWGNDYSVFYESNKDITVHVPDNLLAQYREAYGDYSYLLEKPKGQRYSLSVNGQLITDENLTVKCGDGTAVFNPNTNTLTLKNAVLTESLTPHCCSPINENGDSYPNAAIVSGLDNLTIVIEGTVDVNTTVSNVYGASKEELPKFVRAYGNLELKGSGTLKSTKEDMSFYYKDQETMEYKMYVGSGIVGVKVLKNLTINDINAERLYADVSGDFTINNARLSGGQIIADGSIRASKTTLKPFNAPEGDMQLSIELPAISSKGRLSSYIDCNLDGILLSAGDNAKSLIFENCKINASYQIRGGNDTIFNITNTSIGMYDERIAVTNIPDKNINLKDCKITAGAWNKKGSFVLTATGTKEKETIIGDLDGDNKITSADSLKILRMSVSLEPTTNENKPIADVDGDGKVTSADSLEVLRASVGLPAKGNIGEKYK